MGNFVGADVVELRRLARQFEAGAKALRTAGTRLASQVHRKGWTGHDADDFRLQWDHNHRRLLDGIAQQLTSAAKDLEQEATAQEQASAASTGSIAGSIAPAVPEPGHTPPGVASMDDAAFKEWLRTTLDIDQIEKIDKTEGKWDPFNDEDRSLEDAIAGASPSELAIIKDLLAKGLPPDKLDDLLRGGQVWIDDDGLYDDWRGLDGATRRYQSTHYPGEMTDNQYAINGGLVGHALFGRARGGTWVQFERYSETNPAHGATTGTYLGTKLNVGPWGGSKHTESNPIQLGKDPRPKDPVYVDDGFTGPQDIYRDPSPGRIVDGASDIAGVVSNPVVGGIDAIWGD